MVDAAPKTQPKYDKPVFNNPEIEECAKKMKTMQGMKDDLKEAHYIRSSAPCLQGGAPL